MLCINRNFVLERFCLKVNVLKLNRVFNWKWFLTYKGSYEKCNEEAHLNEYYHSSGCEDYKLANKNSNKRKKQSTSEDELDDIDKPKKRNKNESDSEQSDQPDNELNKLLMIQSMMQRRMRTISLKRWTISILKI